MKYVFARATVSVREPGSKYPSTVHQGSVWHATCPMVLSHPDLFSEDPPEIHPRGFVPPVEQATAAPGERRNARREDRGDLS